MLSSTFKYLKVSVDLVGKGKIFFGILQTRASVVSAFLKSPVKFYWCVPAIDLELLTKEIKK